MPELLNKAIAVANIQQELIERRIPLVTLWNRLEPRPRTDNFNRAMRAEVRDALWMLCKQWQMGEFLGDDAGSPIVSKIQVHSTTINRYVPAVNPVQDFDTSVPLEVQVEQRPIPFQVAEQKISLDIRLLMGRKWQKLISALGNHRAAFISAYPIDVPDPSLAGDAMVTAHAETWQQFAAFANRAMDGYKLYFSLKKVAGHHAYTGITGLTGQESAVDLLAETFVSWYENLFYQPIDNTTNAWNPSFMEYQFAVSAQQGSTEEVMVADEYYQGHLDWYNLDIDPSRQTLSEPVADEVPPLTSVSDQRTLVQSFLPVPVTYDGMPDTRWWAFEDRRTNFGDIKPSTTDIGKLLFLEFSLLYSNDWFLLPFNLDVGTIASVKGMSVTNVFGERYWIESAGSGLDDAWNKWAMFTRSKKGEQTRELTDKSLVLLPTTAKILEGDPVEEIHFIRDEMANMVWAVETQVPLPDGSVTRGSEAATEYKSRLQKIMDAAIGVVDIPAREYKAPILYEVMNSVPENWIPFIPVHLDADNRSVRLQRAAMPRILKGDTAPPLKVRPRTTLLREGLDIDECLPYYVNEEEVSRAGTDLYMSYQRTRWYSGKTFTWLGLRKTTGRGEGNSGLAFDQSRDVKMK